MRTLLPLNVPKNTDSKFPFNAIQNETETQLGTPVVEEIYGDIVTNIYKLLQSVGITPTETQDSDTSQYQILQALKQLPNSLNDIEQVLSLNGATWSVDLNIDLLPNKYFFFARASDTFVLVKSQSFKGTTTTEYSFITDGFKASDELLVIIDNSTVRAYSLSSFYGATEEVFSVFGEPLSFNDSGKMYYQYEGKLFSDEPNIYDLQQSIRDNISASTAVVVDIVITQGSVLCLCFDEPTLLYFFVTFSLNGFNAPMSVEILGGSFGDQMDYIPYMYVGDNNVIYITNALNNAPEDNKFTRFSFNTGTKELTFIGYLDINAGFKKTTNLVIKNNFIYTFISGVLTKYDLSDNTKKTITTFPSYVGRLINFKNDIYFLNGEVAKKWNL